MSKDGCRKIAAMQVALSAGIIRDHIQTFSSCGQKSRPKFNIEWLLCPDASHSWVTLVWSLVSCQSTARLRPGKTKYKLSSETVWSLVSCQSTVRLRPGKTKYKLAWKELVSYAAVLSVVTHAMLLPTVGTLYIRPLQQIGLYTVSSGIYGPIRLLCALSSFRA